ncbi:hypothetical protein FBBAL38_03915 [Flavobacteria bacterium BAL38]|nr:hypothetical protein FBBAL38_03915 [Flavobacteria bacterium BAL38]
MGANNRGKSGKMILPILGMILKYFLQKYYFF